MLLLKHFHVKVVLMLYISFVFLNTVIVCVLMW